MVQTAESQEQAGAHKRAGQEAQKKALYDELRLKIDLFVEGISFDPKVVKTFPIGTEIQEQIHILFDMDRAHHSGFELPSNFYLPRGLFAAFRWDPASPYRLESEGGRPVVFRRKERVAEIEFYARPALLGMRTSDGEEFGHIASFGPEGNTAVCYSNECSLKETGEDCLYCNINSTAGAYRRENIFIKSPKQVGDVVGAAFAQDRANHVNITGGFIPERRELEYYADVADEIRARTGLSRFNGTAVLGAPLDFGVIEKYWEAGYTTIAMNIEIWDENVFKTICPGKDKRCGGRANWVRALEYAVSIFGRGNVRSNIVAGIEPKASILEGVETLASKGVVCFAGAWCPNPGSALEGHRTPEAQWHVDLTHKVVGIYRKYGFTVNQLYNCLGASTPFHDLLRIELGDLGDDGRLSQWKFPSLRKGPSALA